MIRSHSQSTAAKENASAKKVKEEDRFEENFLSSLHYQAKYSWSHHKDSHSLGSSTQPARNLKPSQVAAQQESTFSQFLGRQPIVRGSNSKFQKDFSKKPEPKPFFPSPDSQNRAMNAANNPFVSKNEGNFGSRPMEAKSPEKNDYYSQIEGKYEQWGSSNMAKSESSGYQVWPKGTFGSFSDNTAKTSKISVGYFAPREQEKIIQPAIINLKKSQEHKFNSTQSEARLFPSNKFSASFQKELEKSNMNEIPKTTGYSKIQSQQIGTPKRERVPENEYQIPVHSNKSSGEVKGYGASTNQGKVRNYNEDRASVFLNITKPPTYKDPSCLEGSLFAVYDGHGGTRCADFLKNNFYQYLTKGSEFPKNPKLALEEACLNLEKDFIISSELSTLRKTNINLNQPIGSDHSGSCAIIILILKSQCYCANVGDSRAILSLNNGFRVEALSNDHKPSDPMEQRRIALAGGRVYCNSISSSGVQRSASPNQSNLGSPCSPSRMPVYQKPKIVGPVRVFPGRLSVSRSFGDVVAKLQKYGGNDKVVIAQPEISEFTIGQEHDFILIGSDGIFDKLANEDIVRCVWDSVKKSLKQGLSDHDMYEAAAQDVVQLAMDNNSLDNVTAILICLNGLKEYAKKIRDNH